MSKSEQITSLLLILPCFIFFGAFIGIIVAKAGIIVCGAFLVACGAVVALADFLFKKDKQYR